MCWGFKKQYDGEHWIIIVDVENQQYMLKKVAGASSGFIQTDSHHFHASFIIFSTLGDVLHGLLENRYGISSGDGQ